MPLLFEFTKHENYRTEKGQRVENTDVEFVKGANERFELFEKNKQTVMYDKQIRTNKAKD